MTRAWWKIFCLIAAAVLAALPVEIFSQTGGRALMEAGEMSATPGRAAQGAVVYAVSPLQARVEVSEAGDTLRVAPGFYAGNLRLTKRLVMIGENWPVLSADGRGSIVEIVADSCEIRGFVFEKSGRSLVDEDAGILVRSRGNRIIGNRMRDILFGVYLYEANDNLLAGNTIEGLHDLDLGGRGSGVHIWNSRRNQLDNNKIIATRDGIYMQYAPATVITNNLITEVRYGLHYMYSDSNTFVGNTFSRSLAGAAIMYSDRIIFKRNRFIQNRDFSAFGLLFQDCSFCVADSNVIADNGMGIFLEAGEQNVFRNNRIVGNDVALQIFSSTDRNVFTRNSFEGNRSPLYLVGKRTGTMWEDNGVGNYWSDFDGYDLDADGIGDIPYRIQNIFDFIESRQPSLRLFLECPASQALAAATKTFPIFDISREQDNHPLMQPLEFALDDTSGPATSSWPEAFGVVSVIVLSVAVLRKRHRVESSKN